MPFKIDIQTNINDFDLTVESCSEIINMLQDAYKNLRTDMYSHFLGTKVLVKATLSACLFLLCYFLTQNSIYIFLVPISVIIAFVISIVFAEYITSQSKKIITQQLQHYIKKREMLIKDQKIKV